MPERKQSRVLTIRLSEGEAQEIETLAATRGISLQEAMHQALLTWAGNSARPSFESLYALQGSLGDVDLFELRKGEREFELEKERRWS